MNKENDNNQIVNVPDLIIMKSIARGEPQINDVQTKDFELALGLAKIYLFVDKENEIKFTELLDHKKAKITNPQTNIYEYNGNFNDIHYLVRINFVNHVLFYEVYLESAIKQRIKVLYGEDLYLSLDDPKYPFINNAIHTPPNGHTIIIGPLQGTKYYLQSGSLFHNVNYHSFKENSSFYLFESKWIDAFGQTKLIFYQKIILNILDFFGFEIDLSALVKLYQESEQLD